MIFSKISSEKSGQQGEEGVMENSKPLNDKVNELKLLPMAMIIENSDPEYDEARLERLFRPFGVMYILRAICRLYVAVMITLAIIAVTVALCVNKVNNQRYCSYSCVKAYSRAELYPRFTYDGLELARSVALDLALNDADKPGRIVSCYYNTPNTKELIQLLPSQIQPYLCTHINVAFARIVNKEISFTDLQEQTLINIVKLRIFNPSLKILLSIGGASFENGFSDMIANHASRKIFIKSIKSVLHDYSLDGIDLDWEFPSVHVPRFQLTIDKRERQHFSQLLREIREEYIREKKAYILTVAAAAPQAIVDVAYDVDQLNLYTDYVNIMTYDYHSYTKITPFTGLNSPLYPRSCEQMYMATLNINYTVQMYLDKGLDRNKIVVGIPTYGHSFNLVNADNARVGSPASGFGSLGGMGFVNYLEICRYLKQHPDAVVMEEEDSKVPYLHRGQEWVSFESQESVAAKADFIRSHGLGGAMIYSLNADDFGGLCNDLRGGEQDTFPLLRSITNVLNKNKK